VAPPTPDQQLAFLHKLQRLLAEGQFTATYKFALLLALAELSVETGDDSGDALRLRFEQIAEKFVRLYWRQTLPYVTAGGHTEEILRQNTGKQAEVIRRLEELRRTRGDSLAHLAHDTRVWKQLVGVTTSLIVNMPLGKLQTVGKQQLPFLYPYPAVNGAIDLLPGVAFCFRRFHGLVEDLVQGAWLRFVRNLPANQGILGQTGDLSEFLFGSERGNLLPYVPILRTLQQAACFYCRRPLGGGQHVDHFVPWVRYPVDLAHNFVLAHEQCNSAKGDMLAAPEHLRRWSGRNHQDAESLANAFDQAGLVHDVNASTRIVQWAYARAEAIGAQGWLSGKEFVPLGADWRTILM
jgi:hypothetical protein